MVKFSAVHSFSSQFNYKMPVLHVAITNEIRGKHSALDVVGRKQKWAYTHTLPMPNAMFLWRR